jgi:hypothetical protein
MPCRNGTREHIQRDRARREDHRRYRQTPEYRHWAWLSAEAAATESYWRLEQAQRTYFAVTCLAAIADMGLLWYLRGGGADRFQEALEGLQTIGATCSLEAINQARRDLLGDAEAADPSWLALLDRVDRADAAAVIMEELEIRLGEANEDLRIRLERFANHHRLRDGF